MIGVGDMVYWEFKGEVRSGRIIRIVPHLPCEDERWDQFWLVWLDNGCFIERWRILSQQEVAEMEMDSKINQVR